MSQAKDPRISAEQERTATNPPGEEVIAQAPSGRSDQFEQQLGGAVFRSVGFQ
jgi:hypothetical protein